MDNYSRIAKWTAIMEKLSRLTEARGATADEAALARLKIELLQHRIAQMTPARPAVVWWNLEADRTRRTPTRESQEHHDWYILLNRIQQLSRRRTHR